MKERPILFNGEMVRAIVEGRKTQTRRPMKPQPKTDGNWPFAWLSPRSSIFTSHPETIDYSPVFGRAGDRLWVRETWGCPSADHPLCPDGRKPEKGDKIVYREDPADAWQWDRPGISRGSFVWRPSIHMPRWASRITLEVERVWVEQVQDITIEDIIAEGFSSNLREHDACVDLRMKWESAWDGIYSKTFPLKENPWAWACQFKVIKTEAKK